ncbi:pleckstrin homology domain-containing family O member 2 [Podargus strigoides]
MEQVSPTGTGPGGTGGDPCDGTGRDGTPGRDRSPSLPLPAGRGAEDRTGHFGLFLGSPRALGHPRSRSARVQYQEVVGSELETQKPGVPSSPPVSFCPPPGALSSGWDRRSIPRAAGVLRSLTGRPCTDWRTSRASLTINEPTADRFREEALDAVSQVACGSEQFISSRERRMDTNPCSWCPSLAHLPSSIHGRGGHEPAIKIIHKNIRRGITATAPPSCNVLCACEDTKEEVSEKPKSAPTAEKYGWIKKSSGGLLGLWKDRYIQLRKTQLVVYEDEDEQKCIETVELESYDKCQELRALLKKKNRFILIRSPGKKVHDIKFQAPSLEEKESWIKALNEGINRGKNKVFDEVKVDESLSLDHVTRDRVKMAHGRRPPTRSHLKEAAKSTSDGILRLDLDIVDNGPPNFDSTISESDDAPPQKETPKPLMPPTKPTGTKENQDAENDAPDQEHKKPLSPLLPPDKKLKEGITSKDNINAKEEDSVSPEESVEGSQAPSEENRENLIEVSNRGIAKPPIPLPKSMPDKLKVAWDQPSLEPKITEDLESSGDSSKDKLAEIADTDVTKPPVPPKILSEKMLASMNSSQGDLEAGVWEGPEPGSPKPPVNGITASETAESTSPAVGSEEGNGRTSAEEEQQTSAEETETSLATETEHESIKAITEKKETVESTAGLRLRSSSLGDLLSDSKNTERALPSQGFPNDSHHCLARMEEKVANEREKAEKLLQKVLREGLEQAQEGNGPPVMAETLLNEAVEQLRQATQVLQEIKGLGELKKEATQKGKQKDLVTLYRRSAP